MSRSRYCSVSAGASTVVAPLPLTTLSLKGWQGSVRNRIVLVGLPIVAPMQSIGKSSTHQLCNMSLWSSLLFYYLHETLITAHAQLSSATFIQYHKRIYLIRFYYPRAWNRTWPDCMNVVFCHSRHVLACPGRLFTFSSGFKIIGKAYSVHTVKKLYPNWCEHKFSNYCTEWSDSLGPIIICCAAGT